MRSRPNPNVHRPILFHRGNPESSGIYNNIYDDEEMKKKRDSENQKPIGETNSLQEEPMYERSSFEHSTAN